jgi:hypothetical protein
MEGAYCCVNKGERRKTRKGKKMRGVQRGEHEELVERWKGRSEPVADWDQMWMLMMRALRLYEERGKKKKGRENSNGTNKKERKKRI